MSNENYQPKKQREASVVADVPAVQQSPEARLKALELENRLLKEQVERQQVAKQTSSMAIVPGTHTYIATKGRYSKGVLTPPGGHITVTDEPKARSWVLVAPGDVEAAIAAKSAANPNRVPDTEV